MLSLELKSKNGNIRVFGSNNCPNCREYTITTSDSDEIILRTDEPDLIKSSRIRKKVFNFVKIIKSLIQNFYQYKYDKEMHTILSIRYIMQQEIESKIAEYRIFRGETYEEIKERIKARIQEDPDAVAEAIIHIQRRVEDIDLHMKGLRMVLGEEDVEVMKQKHNLKKVILSIYASFTEDFKKQNLEFNLNMEDSLKTLLDYRLFNLAMHHFFQNAIKYAKPYSKITISFDENSNTLSTVMTSKYIKDIKQIFKDGFSSGDSGTGMGMSVIKKSLEYMGANFYIKNGPRGKDGYARNDFFIIFENVQS